VSYITVAELQKYSNVHDTDEELQQGYIDSAENIIESYLGYSPVCRSYSGHFRGNGSHELQLKARPIVALVSVVIDGASVPLSEFSFNDDSEFINCDRVFPRGADIKIEYSAGWDPLPDSDNLPRIIKLTALRIAALLQTESDSNIGVTSKSFADSGTRAFVNTVDYHRYLIQISSYKLLVI
jgi:hypothetical protein